MEGAASADISRCIFRVVGIITLPSHKRGARGALLFLLNSQIAAPLKSGAALNNIVYELKE